MCFQTLRFVQSLPKRQRQPLAGRFRNADPLGEIVAAFYVDDAHMTNIL